MSYISIHALREEGDRPGGERNFHQGKFLSTPSARRATCAERPGIQGRYYFYPRPPRGGRPAIVVTASAGGDISIHALREEGDVFPSASSVVLINFYPRPPRGGRPQARHLAVYQRGFLSTPSARRATFLWATPFSSVAISIHALREEGDWALWAVLSPPTNFYPRPPRGGRPSLGRARPRHRDDFYPRPPRGGRLPILTTFRPVLLISIHALREEGDYLLLCADCQIINFYPRPPRGGRPILRPSERQWGHFYPRPPRGGRLT